MNKGGFKVGDKVKLKHPRQFKCGTEVLTIVREVGVDNKFIHVVYKGIPWGYFPLLPSEIEHVIKVGEQLMFAFMNN